MKLIHETLITVDAGAYLLYGDNSGIDEDTEEALNDFEVNMTATEEGETITVSYDFSGELIHDELCPITNNFGLCYTVKVYSAE